MRTDSFSRRFDGSKRLYGKEALDLLNQAHIVIAGIGGVGSWAVEALARTGVCHITLIDLDEICITNTNRQIHTLANTIGQSKIKVMAERVQQINPECHVHCIDDFIEEDNLQELLPKKMDYMLDAIDSFRIKAALIAFCKRHKINIITIGSAGGKKDPTKITVADLSKTIQDPLARKMKERLKNCYGFANNSKKRYGVECVFSSEAIVYPQHDGSISSKKPSVNQPLKMDCSGGLGATTMVTATFGFVAVARIIEKLTT